MPSSQSKPNNLQIPATKARPKTSDEYLQMAFGGSVMKALRGIGGFIGRGGAAKPVRTLTPTMAEKNLRTRPGGYPAKGESADQYAARMRRTLPAQYKKESKQMGRTRSSFSPEEQEQMGFRG